MEKLVVIDGNSILNRAFYGIMSSKMLMTADGTYTNAVYGFLAIMFKMIEEVNPDYMVVAFDVKHPTKRHEMYKEYKGTRKGMPDELAEQMPIIKEVLKAMNITVLEKPGYEADDILGTLGKHAEKNGIDAVLLTGDRDSFQLVSKHVMIRMPRTKAGKTETENFDVEKIHEVYGLEPKQLIEVKGLMGDTSDNIPGVPGVGEKTAIKLVKEYNSIDEIYAKLEAGEPVAKGKLKENLENNKDLCLLSRTLGTIDTNAPIEKDLESFRIKPWDFPLVLDLFRKLKFNRYIERFDLENKVTNGSMSDTKLEILNPEDLFTFVELKASDDKVKEVIEKVKKDKNLYYYFENEDRKNDQTLIIKEVIKYINIYVEEDNTVYNIEFDKDLFKEVFESKDILKCGYRIKEDYILLKQLGINPQNLGYDSEIALYVINSVANNYSVEDLAENYLELDLNRFVKEEKEVQTTLFDEPQDEEDNEEKSKRNFKFALYTYVIAKTKQKVLDELNNIGSLKLFNEIEMPVAEILADMQWQGMYVDEKELIKYGNNLKKHIEELRIDIYEAAGEEFNINSPKQLGVILFEKLGLAPFKKTKSGYSTDVEALEKVRLLHPIVDKILEYRQLVKLNSTYVEGLIPFINLKTGRIHTFFHQTVTATGRLSSSEPNLQNIPTRSELGRKLRKVFKAEEGRLFVDADYSQVELRVLAHMSHDETMIEAFNSGEDIHTITASQVFKVPVEEVSKQLRSKAKAVNFGIVYGISEFGLAEQIDIQRYEAKEYIDKYLEIYHGIKEFMQDVVDDAKRKGYVSTEFGRRRYIPELNSKNYMVRKFGDRAAMNSPIQGTAADIMKIAMINVYNKLKESNLKSRIVLQIHDELLIETYEEEKEQVKELLKEEMEKAVKLAVPLIAEVEEGKSWYQAK